MSNNKIVTPQQFQVIDPRTGQATKEFYLLLGAIIRKLNAADDLDSGTATAATIVTALQK